MAGRGKLLVERRRFDFVKVLRTVEGLQLPPIEHVQRLRGVFNFGFDGAQLVQNVFGIFAQTFPAKLAKFRFDTEHGLKALIELLE